MSLKDHLMQWLFPDIARREAAIQSRLASAAALEKEAANRTVTAAVQATLRADDSTELAHRIIDGDAVRPVIRGHQVIGLMSGALDIVQSRSGGHEKSSS